MGKEFTCCCFQQVSLYHGNPKRVYEVSPRCSQQLQCKYAKATVAFHGWVTTRENTDWEKRIHHDSVHAKTFQSRLTLCDPMDCSPPGSSVHGILQARILECIITLSSGDLPHPGMEPVSLISPALEDRTFFYC